VTTRSTWRPPLCAEAEKIATEQTDVAQPDFPASARRLLPRRHRGARISCLRRGDRRLSQGFASLANRALDEGQSKDLIASPAVDLYADREDHRDAT
jgi:hypothetical protein